MRKDNEEQNAQDKKLLSFTPNLLTNLQSFDSNRLDQISNFFKDAFLLLTSHEVFEDQEYRQEWADNVSVIEAMAIPFKNYSNEEMSIAIKTTLLILSQRKEVQNA